MTDFANGLKSLSGNRAITPEASDFLYDAAEHIERMQAALRSIANKCPATCDMTLAHEMAEEAEEALSSQLTSNKRGGENG